MSKFLADLGGRLTSRKFMLTLAGGITLYANRQYTELAGVVIAYLAAEGGVDVASAIKTSREVTDATERAYDDQLAMELHHADV